MRLVAAETSISNLEASDDAEKLIFVQLIDDKGSFNDSALDDDFITDIFGIRIKHNGFRADHKEILKDFYRFWVLHGKPKGLSLDQTLSMMSASVPQEWFTGFTEHPAQLKNPRIVRRSVFFDIFFLIIQMTKIKAHYRQNQCNTAVLYSQILI